jgi:hypothetical protein
MKEVIGIVLLGLFGIAIWKTRQVATTAPRCPTVAELEAINRDVFDGTTDLADAENLARSYDAIAGCEAAAASIRASVLAKKSTATSTKTPTSTTVSAAPGRAKLPVDVDLLVAAPAYTRETGDYLLSKTLDPLSVDMLSSPIRENVRYLIGKPRAEWTPSDLAMYGALAGVGKPPSPGCGGLQEGQIVDDWFARRAFQCGTTVLADHPDNALAALFAHSGGA